MITFLKAIVSFVSDFLLLFWNFPIYGSMTIGVGMTLTIIIGLIISIMWGRRGD